MKTRKLGNFEISAVGLGCMGFSHAYGEPIAESEAIASIRSAYDMGYTFFDTAECYIGTNKDGTISYNEELVGKALKDVRHKVIIATKFGVRHQNEIIIADSRPEVIKASVDGSLKRLGTDCIDLYYQHRIDQNIEPETVAETMAELIKVGKIKSWGVSEATEEYLRRAHKICPITAIQNRYSMMARWYEKLFPTLEELGIAFVAFSPMANGLLTGKYNAQSEFNENGDYRKFMPQFSDEGINRSKELLDLLNNIALEKQATPAQISLAWMLCKRPYIIPIPGGRNSVHIRENLGSRDVILTQNEIRKIDDKLDKMNLIVFGGHKVIKE